MKIPPFLYEVNTMIKARHLSLNMMASIFLCCGSTAVSPSLVCAQESRIPIVCDGTASVTEAPTILRVIIPLTARGTDLKQAAEAMKEKITAARLQLKTLGADLDSLVIDNLAIDTSKSDKHRQMIKKMSLYSRADDVPDREPDAMLMVKQTVTVDWSLKGSGTELLMTCYRLQQEISDTPFNEDGEGSELSAEEKELLEEAEMFGEEDDDNSNDPVLVFMAQISAGQYAALMKEAFEKAQQESQRIAAAVGKKPGKLLTVRETSGSARADYGYDYGDYGDYGGYGQYELIQRLGQQASTDGSLTRTGLTADPLEFSVTITAGFDFAR